MTNEQLRHMHELSEKFTDLMCKKYRKGQKEHGGNLWDKSTEELLDNAINEAIDQVVYLLTLKYGDNFL